MSHTVEDEQAIGTLPKDFENYPYTFISYSHDNPTYKKDLLDKLEQNRTNYWIDTYIPGGAAWNNVLMRRMRQSHVFLAMLSNQYYESLDCVTEIEIAMNEKLNLVPILCEKITTTSNEYTRKKVEHFQMIAHGSLDNIFQMPTVIDCMKDDDAREQKQAEVYEQHERDGTLEEHRRQVEAARVRVDPIAVSTIEAEVRQEFEELLKRAEIPEEPTLWVRYSLFSKRYRAYSEEDAAKIKAAILELLHDQLTNIQRLLNVMALKESRMAYTAAVKAVKQVEYILTRYDFWTYKQNQMLNYFITDSAPLLRLMRSRAMREQPALSKVMILSVKHFASEFDRVIDCIEERRNV